jgi:hypothetical protein
VIEHSRALQTVSRPIPIASASSFPRKRSKSAGKSSTSRKPLAPSGYNLASPSLAPEEAATIKLKHPHPWLKEQPTEVQASLEEHIVDQFMERYVIYPCNQTSSPGFLEHLPSMVKEVNIDGRYALRWAVQAAANADVSKNQDSDLLATKAFYCYGMSLKSLSDSLAEPGKVPDDYDLMTVVVLDIFEVCILTMLRLRIFA